MAKYETSQKESVKPALQPQWQPFNVERLNCRKIRFSKLVFKNIWPP